MTYDFVDLLLYWFFPIVAIVYVVVYSEIFAPIRDRFTGKLSYLANCPICMGAWVGAFVGLCNYLGCIVRDTIKYPVLGLCMGIAVWFLISLTLKEGD